jgi:hypothetical protein
MNRNRRGSSYNGTNEKLMTNGRDEGVIQKREEKLIRTESCSKK